MPCSYSLSAGCAWRLLPHEFPAWQTVYCYFRRWNQDQTWMAINDQLREWIRVSDARASSPSTASLDSQSVKTGGLIQDDIGDDGAKKIKGRKRHQLVDTLGLLILVVVTAATVTDYEGARAVLTQLDTRRHQFPRLVRIWADGGYRGQDFMQWVMDSSQWVWEVIQPSDEIKGFVLRPKRWVVERTCGWMMWNRRLSKVARTSKWNETPTVELLVLSACQTALGDIDAELGFTGLAIQSGVKSALGSLWFVSDEGTLGLMTEFYQSLKTAPIKSAALRQAQIAMLNGQVRITDDGQLMLSDATLIPLPDIFGERGEIDFMHPYYWSAFTMVGNWN